MLTGDDERILRILGTTEDDDVPMQATRSDLIGDISPTTIDKVVRAYIRCGPSSYREAFLIARLKKASPQGLHSLMRAYISIAKRDAAGRVQPSDFDRHFQPWQALGMAMEVVKLGVCEKDLEFFIDECLQLGRSIMARNAAKLRKQPGLSGDEEKVLRRNMDRNNRKRRLEEKRRLEMF